MYSFPKDVEKLLNICESLGLTGVKVGVVQINVPPPNPPIKLVNLKEQNPDTQQQFVVTKEIGTQDIDVKAMLQILDRQPNGEWKARRLLAEFYPGMSYEDAATHIITGPAVQETLDKVFS